MQIRVKIENNKSWNRSFWVPIDPGWSVTLAIAGLWAHTGFLPSDNSWSCPLLPGQHSGSAFSFRIISHSSLLLTGRSRLLPQGFFLWTLLPFSSSGSYLNVTLLESFPCDYIIPILALPGHIALSCLITLFYFIARVPLDQQLFYLLKLFIIWCLFPPMEHKPHEGREISACSLLYHQHLKQCS